MEVENTPLTLVEAVPCHPELSDSVLDAIIASGSLEDDVQWKAHAICATSENTSSLDMIMVEAVDFSFAVMLLIGMVALFRALVLE